MKLTSDFLEKSIADTQATIRALDVKAGFIIVILFTPLYGFDKLHPLFEEIILESTFHAVLIGIISLVWGVAIYTVLMAVAAISNPAKHVCGASQQRGAFYGNDLFSMSVLDTFLNIRNTSTRTVEEEIESLPRDEQSLITELAFERMKLIYIREMKLRRLSFSVWMTVVWLGLSLATYILHLWR